MVGSPRLMGRYLVEEQLAAGGMGGVYAATDERLRRRVAVKVLKEELAGDPRFVERFRREARAVATLNHPNVANVFDYGEEDGRHFIVMELAPGRDLARVLREEGPMDARRARGVAAQICDALASAHKAGIVHRDIKPANVILDDENGVKVTDFGIARAGGEASLTATGSVLGTAHYLSPEQASGVEAGPASDIYSAGIVIFEMLTGSLPFTGESPLAVAMKQVSEPVPPPSSVKPDVPADLDRIVERATQKAPEDRWGSAAEMAAALRGRAAEPRPGPDKGSAGPATTAVMGAAAPAATRPITEASTGPAGVPVGRAPGPSTREAGAPAPARDLSRPITRGVVAVLVLLALAGGGWVLVRAAQDDSTQATGAPAGATGDASSCTEAPCRMREAVIGAPVEALRSVLEDQGYEVVTEQVASSEAAGTVVETDPAPGETLQPGQTVTLSVSSGTSDGALRGGPTPAHTSGRSGA